MCKNGSGKENETLFEQNKVYGSKDRQRKGRKCFRTSESREHSNSQECKYLGITINEEGNLKGHVEELKQTCEAISREIEIMESRNQVQKEEIRVQLKLFEACFMPALIFGIETWGCVKKEEIKEIERIQGKALNEYLNYHWDIDRNRNMACRTESVICNIDVVS